ncbi:MAG: hypothetical protein LIR40_14230 [Bacteroidota bacterium]|nr:hypothetical protein [Bacteroidota bacterium]
MEKIIHILISYGAISRVNQLDANVNSALVNLTEVTKYLFHDHFFHVIIIRIGTISGKRYLEIHFLHCAKRGE